MAGVSNDGGPLDGPGGFRAFRRSFARFAEDEGGATAVEYTLLVAFIALGILGAVRAYSDKMVLVYQALSTAITTP